MSSRRRGFSLLELTVTTIALLTLASLLLPSIRQMREAVRRTECSHRVSQFQIAIAQWESAHSRLPSAWRPIPGTQDGWSTHSQILPFLDQSALYNRIDFSQSWRSVSIDFIPPNATSASSPTSSKSLESIELRPFQCPTSQRGLGLSGISYAVNRGRWLLWNPTNQDGGDGPFVAGPRGVTLDECLDGISFTLSVGEVLPSTYRQNGLKTQPLAIPNATQQLSSLGGTASPTSSHQTWVNGQAMETGFTTAIAIPWSSDWINLHEGTHPSASSYGIIRPESNHPGGWNVSRLDGSVHFLSSNLDRTLLHALATRSGGEPEFDDER